MNILAVIPARGGSKGIPGKNIKPLAGKPLLVYTIEAARQGLPQGATAVVSTDNDAIAEVAAAYGMKPPFMRPDELATDTATSYDALIHAIDWYERTHDLVADVVIMLQPTSPLREGKHISEALALYHEGLDMVVSVKETDANPYYLLFEENEEGYLEPSKEGHFTRRQDCPVVYEYNGAVYVVNLKSLRAAGSMRDLKKIVKYPMPSEISVDLDTPIDWEFAEFLINRTSGPA
jgi:N-acylneuraminate cytidylyltransferase